MKDNWELTDCGTNKKEVSGAVKIKAKFKLFKMKGAMHKSYSKYLLKRYKIDVCKCSNFFFATVFNVICSGV